MLSSKPERISTLQYFDTQISTLLNLQALFSVTEISKSTPLPIDGSIFTGDPKNLSLWTDAGPRPFFRQTLDDLITNGSLSQPLTPFGGVLLAMTLYRFVSYILFLITTQTPGICSFLRV